MDIYIVTSGSYSDYSINTVYLDKDLAEAHAARLEKVQPFSGVQVEVWPVGEALPVVMYRVILTYPTVQITKRRSEPDYSQPPVVSQGYASAGLYDSADLPKTAVGVKTNLAGEPVGYSGVGYGRTPEAAEKSLWDALAAYKAEEAGL